MSAQRETFNALIAKNRRNSFLLMLLMLVLLAVLGAVMGGVYGHFEIGLGAAGVAFVLMLLITFLTGRQLVMAFSGAKRIEKADAPQLFNVVEEMSIAAGVPMPKVYIIEEEAPNAFATGISPKNAAVAVTTGLLKQLSRDELQGVIAHEMGHIRNFDIRYSILMAVMVGGIVILCDIFLRSSIFASSRRDSRDKGNAQIVIVVIGIVLMIVAPLIALLIQMAVSRQREYLADASAVEFTRNPEGLAAALQKLSASTVPMESNRATEHMYIVSPELALRRGAEGLFSTHPPIETRIERLRKLL